MERSFSGSGICLCNLPLVAVTVEINGTGQYVYLLRHERLCRLCQQELRGYVVIIYISFVKYFCLE